MPLLLMRNLNSLASWPMYSLLLLKVSPLCLRVPRASGKTHKGLFSLETTTRVRNWHPGLAPYGPV
ncbi:hypothetical protein Godav_015187, partial [Gossypium davidsonii]|nr:hypothetical protein [Gossypium lobatum]MBA0614984.1 hypothetical protein [Gossypium davidsonii]MBA0650205.1 hypothetical protein [Gossypium klotzschianum]